MSKLATAFLNNLLKTPKERSELLKVISVIRTLAFVDLELFSKLKKEAYFDTDLSFDDLKPFLEQKDFFYHIPPFLYGSMEFGFVDTRALEQKIRETFYDYLKERLASTKDNIGQYKFYYKSAIEFSLRNGAVGLDQIALNFTYHLVLCHEYEFLSSLLLEVCRRLDHPEYLKTNAGKMAVAIISYWQSLIYHDFKSFYNAMRTVERSIELFSKVNKDEGYDKDDYLDWFTQAFLHKSTLQFERRNFTDAYDLIADSIKISNTIEAGRQRFLFNVHLGGFYQAEIELLEFLSTTKKMTNDITTEKIYSYDLARYYQRIGLFREAIEQGEKVIALSKEANDELWEAAGVKEVAISLTKAAQNGITISKHSTENILDMLHTSKIKMEKLGRKEHVQHILFWTTKNYLVLNQKQNAKKSFEEGFEMLIKSALPQTKDYVNYLYLFKELYPEKTDFDRVDLEAHMLNNFSTILPFFQDMDIRISANNSERPLKHDDAAFLERMINPEIRTNGYKQVEEEDTGSLVAKIREDNLCFLPHADSMIEATSFKIPFYRNYKLMMLTFKSGGLKHIRYFLYYNREIIYLDNSNKTLYSISETDLDIQSPEHALLYIRFFFDTVSGKRGRFYMLEGEEYDFPYHAGLSEKKIADVRASVIKKMDNDGLLFTKSVKGSIYMNFSIYLLFKDSLFDTKIELDTNTGQIRLYDETVVLEELPFAVDLKSILN